jgi:signal transduction histidine kinase/CheY-like chemotaxis protein
MNIVTRGRDMKAAKTADAQSAFHEALAHNAPQYMFVLDELGAIQFANRADVPVPVESLVGSGAWLTIGAEPEAMRDAIGRVAASGTAETLEVRVAHADSARWYCAVLKRADNLAGGVKVLLFLSDITEGQQAHEALRKTVRELEESRRQTAQAQKMESIGRLAGGVAHDFNNLLTAIISFSRFVMDDLAPGDPRRSDLVEVLKAADSAAKLTSQLLAFSRKRAVEPVLMDLNTSVTRLSKVLRRTLEESIGLTVVESPMPVHVMFDPGQLDQLLMNIAVNARDAMSDGGKLTLEIGTLRIDNHRELPAGEYAALSISDTGSGMSDEVLAQIFEPFFSTKGDKGTGLGLATCYGIVKQAQGHIDVESRIGVGSRFIVLLPLAAAVADAVVAGKMVSAPPRQLSGLAVVVEDQAAIRRTMMRSLQNVGFNVIEACTAEEALAIVQDLDARVDLLVTDVVLPGLSGIKLADMLRSRQPDLRVLVCSGYMGHEQDSGVVLNERTAFLAKPFTGHELISKATSLF